MSYHKKYSTYESSTVLVIDSTFSTHGFQSYLPHSTAKKDIRKNNSQTTPIRTKINFDDIGDGDDDDFVDTKAINKSKYLELSDDDKVHVSSKSDDGTIELENKHEESNSDDLG